MLIVEVDAASREANGEERRYDVRLVRSVREVSRREGSRATDAGEVTAVVVLRDASPSRVVSCVRAATRDGASISPELLHQMLPAVEERDAQGPQGLQGPHATQLSDREYDVLRMLADGESTRGIAERLSYSERTVKNIVRDLLSKLDCRTRAHAVALAVRQGVI
ncbi:MAG TPA: response regulator transcription factor [Solirubrobacteraceae bacterium]|nr:response regulator transcription factor [Solirubrobacteraceae bacterium]